MADGGPVKGTWEGGTAQNICKSGDRTKGQKHFNDRIIEISLLQGIFFGEEVLLVVEEKEEKIVWRSYKRKTSAARGHLTSDAPGRHARSSQFNGSFGEIGSLNLNGGTDSLVIPRIFRQPNFRAEKAARKCDIHIFLIWRMRGCGSSWNQEIPMKRTARKVPAFWHPNAMSQIPRYPVFL
ncbi:hypothetical protein RUND412_004419 [Rhizina undulata]